MSKGSIAYVCQAECKIICYAFDIFITTDEVSYGSRYCSFHRTDISSNLCDSWYAASVIMGGGGGRLTSDLKLGGGGGMKGGIKIPIF